MLLGFLSFIIKVVPQGQCFTPERSLGRASLTNMVKNAAFVPGFAMFQWSGALSTSGINQRLPTLGLIPQPLPPGPRTTKWVKKKKKETLKNVSGGGAEVRPERGHPGPRRLAEAQDGVGRVGRRLCWARGRAAAAARAR